MKWITRERIRVGRIGCAWLISRFVDPEAEFFFASGADLHERAQALGATIYHERGSELARRGAVSSFEAVMERYGLGENPALALLGRIVNTADIATSPYRQPEGYGLRAILDGMLLLDAYQDDYALLEAGKRVYDALFAYCEDAVRRGKPEGAFKAPE